MIRRTDPMILRETIMGYFIGYPNVARIITSLYRDCIILANTINNAINCE